VFYCKVDSFQTQMVVTPGGPNIYCISLWVFVIKIHKIDPGCYRVNVNRFFSLVCCDNACYGSSYHYITHCILIVLLNVFEMLKNIIDLIDLCTLHMWKLPSILEVYLFFFVVDDLVLKSLRESSIVKKPNWN
jgi:hypothetical protein